MYKDESDGKYKFKKFLFKDIFTNEFFDLERANQLIDKNIEQIVVLLKKNIYENILKDDF